MSIHLAFLGTGTCDASSRNPSAMVLSDGQDILCIDFGGGAYHQMARLGNPLFRYRDISAIFLTHYHMDHVSGLPDFFWGSLWDTAGKRTRPLTLAGPPGLEEFYTHRLLPFIGDYEIPFEVTLRELPDGGIHTGSFFTAESRRLEHGDSSTGYLFNAGGFRLGVTGDTGFCDRIPLLLKESDAAVMEWGIQGTSAYLKHLSTEDVIRMLKAGVMPPRVFVTHMYLPPGVNFAQQVRENKKLLEGFPAEFFFPSDGDIYMLSP